MTQTQTSYPLLTPLLPPGFREQADNLSNERTTLVAAIKSAEARMRQIHREENALTLVRKKAFFEQFRAENQWPLSALLDALRSSGENSAYKAYKQLCNFPGINAPGSYWQSTGQYVIQLDMHRHRDGEVEATAESLEFLLPHLKAENGLVRLGIFDAGSSGYSAFFDSVTPQHCHVAFQRNGWKDPKIAQFESIVELLRYVQENHFYSDDLVVDD